MAQVSMIKRFTAKYAVNKATGCWEWQAAKTGGGYGLFWLEKTFHLAHRVAYEVLIGPIPEGLTIDHICKNPGCVNPSHMEPVTQGENLRRSESWSGQNMRKTHCPQGHPYEGDNLKLTKEGFRQCRICTREKTKAWQQTQEAKDYHRDYARKLYHKRRSPDALPAPAERTHCPQGHAYEGENLIVLKHGRACRACARQRQRAYVQRQRGAQHEG
jgi:hypothetical protein